MPPWLLTNRLSGLRGFLLGGLVALYACAQLVGLMHAAKHLSQERATPHVVVCAYCVAAVESGGAPLAVVPTVPMAAVQTVRLTLTLLMMSGAVPVPLYRSRAPPATA